MTIARSRKHIQTFYDTKEIGQFPERLKPLVVPLPAHAPPESCGFNEIFANLLTAEARRLCAGQLRPAEPAAEVRRAVRHRGGGRRWQAWAGRP